MREGSDHSWWGNPQTEPSFLRPQAYGDQSVSGPQNLPRPGHSRASALTLSHWPMRSKPRRVLDRGSPPPLLSLANRTANSETRTNGSVCALHSAFGVALAPPLLAYASSASASGLVSRLGRMLGSPPRNSNIIAALTSIPGLHLRVAWAPGENVGNLTQIKPRGRDRATL